ncbi:MAG: Ig-like domain repeat protein [Candidatus Rokuibacteriota bacterium]
MTVRAPLSRLSSVTLVGLTLLAWLAVCPAAVDASPLMMGAGPGGGAHVRVFSGVPGPETHSFLAFPPAFTGGVHVALGDVTGDGVADLIVGAGPGSGPHVKVFDGMTGAALGGFFAYDPGFTGGVSVAAGDVTGDGRADIVTGAGPGGGPHVKVFDGATGLELGGVVAYDPGFTGGVFVAAGDVTGDGRADVITGTGAGIGPHVKVFDGATGAEVASFFAYDPGFMGGVRVAGAAVTGLTFTSADATMFTVGVPASFTVTTLGPPPVTIDVTGALPAGVTFSDHGDGTATLGGTPGPGTDGTYALTFTASHGVPPDAIQAFTLTVAAVATTTSLAPAPTPSVFGEPVTLTVTVTPVGADPSVPAGTVTFKDGPTTLGTEILDEAGQAVLVTTALPVGTRALTAEYSGDGHFGPSTTAPAVAHTVTAAGTTTTLGSSGSPSDFGEPVTFTATVAVVPPGGGTATGTVEFFDGATSLGTGALDGAGQATLTTSALALGAHAITAAYAGDGSYSGSTSTPALTQTVDPAATTTALGSSANPSVVGQGVTVTATVTAAPPASGTPTGTVMFTVDGTPQAPVALAGGQVSLALGTGLALGAHTIEAQYGGDANFTASTAAPLTQTVNQAATTTAAVQSSVNPSVFGQSVQFTATVTVTPPGGGTATGTVEFFDGAASLGTGTLDGAGQATVATTSLAAGSRAITAVYAGTPSFTGSTSPALTQTVDPAATTTAVASSVNPSVVGQSVQFTATVTITPPGAGTPTGTVSFRDGGGEIGTGTLDGAGQATFMTTTLSVAGHDITAVYAGTASFAGSTSAPLTQTVNQAATTTAVSSLPNPSGFAEMVIFTATVSAVAPGAGTPAGSVSFRDGGLEFGSGMLNGAGQATFSTSALSVGTHAITAVYAGSASFAGSTSAPLAHVVQIVANPDGYTATGNIAITHGAPGVLGNDSNGGAGLSVGQVQGSGANVGAPVATSGNGSVTLNANGSFTYDPPAGVTGTTDTFTYQATDGVGSSNTTTVTITLSDILWFVCDGCGGTGVGTLLNPYTSVGAFSTANTGAAPAPQPDHKVYIRSGMYDGAADTLTLRSGQQVWGQGVAASAAITPDAATVAAFVVLTAGARPTIAPTSGNGIGVASNNTLQHLDVGAVAAGARKIFGTGFGTLTTSQMTLSGSGQALDLTTGTLSGSFDGITSTSGVTNVFLSGVGTSGTFALGSGALSGATNDALEIDGGTGSFSYSGTITNTSTLAVDIRNKTGGTVTLSGDINPSAAARGISVSGNTGGTTVTFSGANKKISTGASPGVNLSSNTGATISFTNGGLDIAATSGAGFNASGGGTVNVTTGANANTINSGSGTALNVANTIIGASGLTFQSISANGSTNGIVLNATGSNGGLTVTGTGTTAGSGGTIQNIATRGAQFISTRNVSLSNMDFTNACLNDGAVADGVFGGNTDENAAIYLQSATNVSFANIHINGSAQHGINGNLVTHLTITDSLIENTGNAVWESGIFIENLRGTSAAGTATSISNSAIQNTGQFNIWVQNDGRTNAPGSPTTYAAVNRADMDQLTLANMTFLNSGISVIGDHVSVFNAGTANFRTVVTSSTFSALVNPSTHTSDNIQVDASVSAHSDFDISGGTFAGAGQAAINVSASGTGFATVNVHDNPNINVRAGIGINVAINGDSETRGYIQDNPLIYSNVGNNPGAGINIVVDQTGRAAIDLDNNVITTQPGTPANGFQIGLRGMARNAAGGELDLTVQNNTVTVANSGTNGFEGITLDAGNATPGENVTVCVNLTSNSIDGTNSVDYFFTQYAPNTFRIQGLTGDGTNVTNVANFVASRDTDPSGSDPTVDVQGGLIVNYTNAVCAAP